MDNQVDVDIAVIGSGFTGSLTALILQQIGYKVCLVEKNRHPRFSIGESSTPVADIILRDLADNYHLAWLKPFSRYGSWQQHYPEITCGLKRGFSYYKHSSGKPFTTDDGHSRELLVAASLNNKQSDTNWLRSEIDAFLVSKVREAGILYWDQSTINILDRVDRQWSIQASQKNSSFTFTADWIIDATGNGHFLEKHLNISSSSNGFKTHSSALFSHFKNIKPWSDWLNEHHINLSDYPYNPDHSALHHLLDEGWMWMLRFNNSLTSAGIVFNHKRFDPGSRYSPQSLWQHILKKYPSLESIFQPAKPARQPGTLIQSGRLQRRLAQAVGEGWIALPHTAGFVDPLHSTGIAHALSGIERIAYIFSQYGNEEDQLNRALKTYEEAVFDELSFIDLLVSGCMDTTRHFELFNLYSMLYFTAAISYEKIRLDGRFSVMDQFLCTSHKTIATLTNLYYEALQDLLSKKDMTESDIRYLRKKIMESIEPFNTAGLLKSPVPNMYHHTAVKIP